MVASSPGTLAFHFVLIVASAIALYALGEYHKVTSNVKGFYYYEGYSAFGSSARKMAKAGEVVAVISLVASCVALGLAAMESSYRRIVGVVQACIVVPFALLFVGICAGFYPDNGLFNQPATHGGAGSLPDMDKAEELFQMFVIGFTFLIIAVAVGCDSVVAGLASTRSEKSAAFLHIAYIIALTLMFVASVFVLADGSHVPATCNIRSSETKLYRNLRRTSGALTAVLGLEVVAVLGMMLKTTWGAPSRYSQNENHSRLLRVGLSSVKYVFMCLLFSAFAMTATERPCMIRNQDSVTGGVLFAMGVGAFLSVAIAAIGMKVE